MKQLTALLFICASLLAQTPDYSLIAPPKAPAADMIAPLPVTLDYQLLGSTFIDPTCEGCGFVPVKTRTLDTDEWDTIPFSGSFPGHQMLTGPQHGHMSWNVTTSATNMTGFGLILNAVSFYNSWGTCVWRDSSNQCVNGKSCMTTVVLALKAYAQPNTPGFTATGGGPIWMELPGEGTVSFSVSPTGNVDPNTGLIEYEGSFMWTVKPGCGQSTELTLDRTAMDPRTVDYDYQFNSAGDPMQFKIECEVCPEDPIN